MLIIIYNYKQTNNQKHWVYYKFWIWLVANEVSILTHGLNSIFLLSYKFLLRRLLPFKGLFRLPWIQLLYSLPGSLLPFGHVLKSLLRHSSFFHPFHMFKPIPSVSSYSVIHWEHSHFCPYILLPRSSGWFLWRLQIRNVFCGRATNSSHNLRTWGVGIFCQGLFPWVGWLYHTWRPTLPYQLFKQSCVPGT
jgi:hypothetical protein